MIRHASAAASLDASRSPARLHSGGGSFHTMPPSGWAPTHRARPLLLVKGTNCPNRTAFRTHQGSITAIAATAAQALTANQRDAVSNRRRKTRNANGSNGARLGCVRTRAPPASPLRIAHRNPPLRVCSISATIIASISAIISPSL